MKINWFNWFYTLFTAAIAILALVMLGFNWMYDGYGLNPWYAFPLAGTIFGVGLHILVVELFYEDIPENEITDEQFMNHYYSKGYHNNV